MGGLRGDEAPGVLGTRIGDEKTGLVALGPLAAMGEVCWARCARTASLCSATEDRAGVSAACLGACNASDAGQRAGDGDADATSRRRSVCSGRGRVEGQVLTFVMLAKRAERRAMVSTVFGLTRSRILKF